MPDAGCQMPDAGGWRLEGVKRRQPKANGQSLIANRQWAIANQPLTGSWFPGIRPGKSEGQSPKAKVRDRVVNLELKKAGKAVAGERRLGAGSAFQSPIPNPQSSILKHHSPIPRPNVRRVRSETARALTPMQINDRRTGDRRLRFLTWRGAFRDTARVHA